MKKENNVKKCYNEKGEEIQNIQLRATIFQHLNYKNRADVVSKLSAIR